MSVSTQGHPHEAESIKPKKSVFRRLEKGGGLT